MVLSEKTRKRVLILQCIPVCLQFSELECLFVTSIYGIQLKYMGQMNALIVLCVTYFAI